MARRTLQNKHRFASVISLHGKSDGLWGLEFRKSRLKSQRFVFTAQMAASIAKASRERRIESRHARFSWSRKIFGPIRWVLGAELVQLDSEICWDIG